MYRYYHHDLIGIIDSVNGWKYNGFESTSGACHFLHKNNDSVDAFEAEEIVYYVILRNQSIVK